MRPLPKSVQLSEMLIREIASGRLPNGTRLPTERNMAAELNVAVGTLRKSLNILEEKGMLKRVQGSGNYVQFKPDVKSVYTFFRLELPEGGGLPTAVLISVDKLKRPDKAAEFKSKLAYRIRRLRCLDETPVAVEEIWLDARFSASLTQDDLSDSLYLDYKTKLNLVISSVEDKVGVAQVPSWKPKEFALKVSQYCGFIERLAFDQAGELSEYSENWFHPELAHYTNRIL